MLRPVFLNLISNAQQSLQESPRADKQITVTTQSNDARVEIIFEDNGPGVPDDLQGKIYEPLFSTKNFGIGLGMTIVRDIRQRHQGSIELKTPHSQGACFVISLPSGNAPRSDI